MRACALLLGLFVVLTPVQAASRDDFQQLYHQLLREYWRPPLVIHGISTTVLDYAALSRDARKPGSLYHRALAALASYRPEGLRGDEDKAFWLNAYNFGAIHLVVENYPVDSIRSLKISLLRHPWSKKALNIGGHKYALQEIEKDKLLRRHHDPRIVFGVSCAAVSCPDRMPEAFSAARLDAQLDSIVRNFFANPTKGARLDRRRRVLTLSWILKKDAALFDDMAGGVLNFVLPYLSAADGDWLRGHPVEIRYFTHDWTLNDLAQAGT